MKNESAHEPEPPTPKAHSRVIQVSVLVGLVAFVFFTWVWVGLWWPGELASHSDTRGQFGDQFGSVNSLFAGLAFAGLSYTIWLQRTEIALQRKDLALTQKEIKESTKAQKEAAVALTAQLRAQALAAELNALTAIMTHHHTELVEARKMPGVEGSATTKKSTEIARCHDLLDKSRNDVHVCMTELKKCSVLDMNTTV